MKWCAHCKRHVKTRVQKTGIRAIKLTRFVYHCLECNGFIEAEQVNDEEGMGLKEHL